MAEVSRLFWDWIHISVTTDNFGAVSRQGSAGPVAPATPQLHRAAAAEVGTKSPASFGVSVGACENQVLETARLLFNDLQDPEKMGE